MEDFFISYNKADRDWAEWLAWILEEADYSVVVQAWDFRPGDNFVLRMHEALDETRKLIAVLSEDYLNATYTKVEWAAAIVKDPTGQNRTLLPVRVKECTPTGLLAAIVYVDLVGLPEEDARVAVIRAFNESVTPVVRPTSPGKRDTPLDEHVVRDAKPYPGIFIAAPGRGKGRETMPDIGAIVPKGCNRTDQQETFDTSLRDGVRNCCSYPQLYVVHGPARERHASLVERLRETLIQEYADFLSGQQKSTVSFWELKWPNSGRLMTDLSRLIEELIVKRDPRYRYEKYDYSAAAFREMILPLKNQVIVLQHEIDAEKWNPTSAQLIEAYLKFWDEVKSEAEIPQFLIFLNVVYPAVADPGLWRIWEKIETIRRRRENQQIKETLGGICNLPDRQPFATGKEVYCLSTLLKELSCVRLKDVEDWFKKYRLGKNEVAWETQSKNIFRLKGWDFTDCKNMADVEDALDEFITVMSANITQTPKARPYQ